MDMLREGELYRSSMRLFSDRPDVLTPGRWYFCQPGAQWVPFAHAFGSSAWHDDEWEEDPPIGEVFQAFIKHRKKGNPRLAGRKVCGSKKVWQEGVPYSQRGTLGVDDDGVPVCCTPNPFLPGPAAAGGSCRLWHETPMIGSGGALGGGYGEWATGFRAFGGAVADGPGLFTPGFRSLGGALGGGSGGWVMYGQGGALGDGAGVFTPGFRSMSGAVGDGAGDFTPGFTSIEGGGLGNGSGEFGSSFPSEGGGLGDGAGEFTPGYASAGGGLGNGAGTFGTSFPGAGGGEGNGAGTFGASFPGVGGGEGNGAGTFTVGFDSAGGGMGGGAGDWEEVEVIAPGIIVGYGAASTPTGWLNCDGAAVSRATYAALFAVVGTSYGVGDGSTTFNVPDLKGRTMLGEGTGTALSARAIGDKSGAETHTLSASEMPSHTHAQDGETVRDLSGSASVVSGIGASRTKGGTTGSAGSGSAHNNMQPYNCARWIIKT